MENYAPFLSAESLQALPVRARRAVEYRKSGLSLNHVQGCPLDCAYCIRHTYGLWDHRQPHALMSDDEAVEQLVTHRYFQPHLTPLQIFNRATDPFLLNVKGHLFAVLKNLDDRGLTNHALVITRCRVIQSDCEQLASFKNLKVTLLFTYSGITNPVIEPFSSRIAVEAMRTASAYRPRRYRTIFYLRPLVPGLNDSPDHLARAAKLSRSADAAVFTGLFYRDEIATYYRANKLPEPYSATARRKILPATLENRVLEAFKQFGGSAIFRKTSCGVAYAHGLPDYNGHYGIREVCDICPIEQVARCSRVHAVPSAHQLMEAVSELKEAAKMRVVNITNRAAMVNGLPDEQVRYFLQHRFSFQIHDAQYPHEPRRHGRAEIGWTSSEGQS